MDDDGTDNVNDRCGDLVVDDGIDTDGHAGD